MSPTPEAARPVLTAGLLLLLPLAGAGLLHRIGAAPLLDTDEPRYAAPAREMARGGDLLLPRFNDRLRLDKPILYYWLAAGSIRVLGESEAAPRLVSALATLGAAWIAFLWARRLLGERAGLLAAAVHLTAFFSVFLGRLSTTDATLCFWVALALWLHARRGPGGFPRALDALPFHAVLGLAALTKGPVGVIVPLLVILASIAGRGFLARARALRPLPGLLVFAAVALPWYLAVPLHIGWEPALDLLGRETVSRFAGGEMHREPVWFFPMMALAGFLPWTMFLPAALSWSRGHAAKARTPLLWIAVVLVFFSLSPSKLPSYILSLFVPLSILTGCALEGPAAGRRGPAWASGLTFALLGAGALVFPEAQRRARPDEPALDLLPLALTALGAVPLLAFVALRRPRRLPAAHAGAAAVFLLIAHSGPLDPFYLRRSSRDAATLMARHALPGDELIAYPRLYPGLVYYSDRPFLVPATRPAFLARLRETRPADALLREKDLEALPCADRALVLVLERLRLAGRRMAVARTAGGLRR